MDKNQNKNRKWQKLTNQRTQILEFLQTAKNHPTAEDIYKELKPHLARLSLSTIYRNLQSLEFEKVICSIKTPDRKIHYEEAGPDHAHFFCDHCQKLLELPLIELIDIKNRLKAKGYEIQKINFVIQGTCPICAELF